MKNYYQAPLPFRGQKRTFIKDFKEVLTKAPADAIYIDLFGGSGLLSHNIKQLKPKARVIYNDFDNYTDRLENIPKTNKLIADLREITSEIPYKKRLIGNVKQRVYERIEQEKGFIDWVTLSANILFSGRYMRSKEHFNKETLFNRVVSKPYDAKGYLDGVEVVHKCYKEVIDEFKGMENVILICDPPYLSTENKGYASGEYWKISDYLDILKVLDGRKYIYFTSNKSNIEELLKWVENHYGVETIFSKATTYSRENKINYNSLYEDRMICNI